MLFLIEIFFSFYLLLRIKPRTLYILDKDFTTELHSQFFDVILYSAMFLLIE